MMGAMLRRVIPLLALSSVLLGATASTLTLAMVFPWL